MKILWIEDFGVKQPSKIIIEIFKEFFKELELSDVYKPDNSDVAGQLSDLFSNHTLHEVVVCKSYVEWKKVDEEQRGDFDIALIDINLESEPTPDSEWPEGINTTEFDKKAGFYIYHQLLKRGFPDDNIAFFTAEAQSLKEFSSYCGDIFLDKPAHCFQKNSANFKQLRRWLAEKTLQQSLILRRGIIEGCRFMKERIAAIESSELETQLIFYKTIPSSVNGDPEVLRRDSVDYLSRLERFFLSHRSYDSEDLINIFTKELAAKWEASRGYFLRPKKAPQFRTWLEEQFHKTAQFQMKLLRNWSHHRLLSNHLTEKEIAFFFMWAMRSLVDSDLDETFRYEKILAMLFRGMSDLELTRQMNSALAFHLERSYEQLKALHKDVLRLARAFSDEKRASNNPNRKFDNHFLGMFRELGEVLNWLEQFEKADPEVFQVLDSYRRRIKQVSPTLFYQSFWHGLFPLQIKSTYYADMQTIKFNLEPLPPSFLSFLGQTIFAECFEEEYVAVNVA